MVVLEAIGKFLEDKNPDTRYASFDYCYNYFYFFYKKRKILDIARTENLQISCLQLGFYLASWGMMRGSSFLLNKSLRNHTGLIKAISEMDPVLWEIDVDNYTAENIALLLDCKNALYAALAPDKPSDTLITKVMLGVFANIPAFDRNFKNGLGVNSVNEKSLEKLRGFYLEKKHEFDSIPKIHTLDFHNGKETDVFYTKAKLVDMYGFIVGQGSENPN